MKDEFMKSGEQHGFITTEHAERPVSPTASATNKSLTDHERARRYYYRHADKHRTKDGIDIAAVMAAYASSQSDKLRGLGQEAAKQILGMYWLMAGSDESDSRTTTKLAAIIDQVIAERLKK